MTTAPSWRFVQREPTEAMLEAGAPVFDRVLKNEKPDTANAETVWSAMFDASPPPAAVGDVARARELLAAEYYTDMRQDEATHIRLGILWDSDTNVHKQRALRAISRALSQPVHGQDGADRETTVGLRLLHIVGILRELSDAADDVNGEIDRQISGERQRMEDCPPGWEFDVSLNIERIVALNAAICRAQALLRQKPSDLPAASPPPVKEEVGKLVKRLRARMHDLRHQQNNDGVWYVPVSNLELAALIERLSGSGEDGALEMALAAGALVAATDGSLRAERQRVLDAIKAWESRALSGDTP